MNRAINNKYNTMMEAAGKKIQFSKASLQGKDKTIRDENGFSYCANRLLNDISNFCDNAYSGYHLLNEAIAEGLEHSLQYSKNNFSAGDLDSVYDMDVIDISIASTIASHGLTYVAMERAMKSVKQNIEFQKLIAANSAAGFTKGQTVVDPRLALYPGIDIGRGGALLNFSNSSAVAIGDDIKFSPSTETPVIPGESHIYSVDSSGVSTEIGFTTLSKKPTVEGIETVVFSDGGYFTSASINTNTGEFHAVGAIKALAASTIKVVMTVDRIAETSGSNTLKLRPKLDSIELEATENRIILNTEIEVQEKMNKIFRENSQFGIDVDYGKRAIDQLVMLYTYFIDTRIIAALWTGAENMPVTETIDLSGYSTSDYKSFAMTKNDRLNQSIRRMQSAMVNRTNQALTALICDEISVLMLSSDANNFKDTPAFYQRRDGLVGYYNNTPVIRNAYLNGKAGKDKGVVLGVHKSANGAAAPVAFGSYLPPYSTMAAINPMNPSELAQALFSQTATQCVVPEFIVKGIIIPFVG